ncbi:cation transporter [Asticcacaulis taihuensis]|uniref:cation transporter n=1 Tax=Asticcacaulis taihuensis TaxID=260084 RepID=UPI0026EF9675|nr:cation diffusion facilitator family transporter [Asticcacaulis taihuensis]
MIEADEVAANRELRRAVIIVALANLAYFGIEFIVARKIGSVSLFADSVDFFEDASVNLLIAVGLGWSRKLRARAGMAMALILLAPAVAFVWTAWQKFHTFAPPEPWALSGTGLGALIVNLACAFLLARFQHHKGSLTRAAFLSARNDAAANVVIMFAGGVTMFWHSAWPDLVVGIGIAIMNADAAREIWQAAKSGVLG